MLKNLKEGDRISVSGYADELGLKDYGAVSVETNGTVTMTPPKYAKKILVTLDSIDGEGNVTVLLYRKHIQPIH